MSGKIPKKQRWSTELRRVYKKIHQTLKQGKKAEQKGREDMDVRINIKKRQNNFEKPLEFKDKDRKRNIERV